MPSINAKCQEAQNYAKKHNYAKYGNLVCLSLVTLQQFTEKFSMIPPIVFDIKWKRDQQTIKWDPFDQ